MKTPVQSPAAYTPCDGRARDPVDGDEAALVEGDAGLLEPQVGGLGHRAQGQQAVGADDLAAVLQRDGDAVAVAGHRGHARLAEHGHAATLEDLLEHLGGVGVLPRQHPVAAADQRDLDAQRVVGAGELGAGDARTRPRRGARAAPRGRRPAPRSGSARRRAARWAACAGRHRWRPGRCRPRCAPRRRRPAWPRRCGARRAGRCRRCAGCRRGRAARRCRGTARAPGAARAR